MELFLDGKVTLHCGDSRDVLRELPDNSLDSACMDPPYALVSITKRFGKEGAAPAKQGATGAYARASAGFMGKQWDTGETAFAVEFWELVLAKLKPGAHLAAFSGTRTYHRMACAIEDAGFEIRDQLAWTYGAGFPKSHDIAKAIDKAAGAERKIIGVAGRSGSERNSMAGNFKGGDYMTTEPATDDAKHWDGWGTALKPAWEPIVLARKPISEKSVAANVLRWGTGAINVDGCRVDAGDELKSGTYQRAHDASIYNGETSGLTGSFVYDGSKGRFPANLIHDGSPEVLAAFPDAGGQSGASIPGGGQGDVYGVVARVGGMEPRDDSGSAARFFYEAQPDDLLIWQAKAILRSWNQELANTADDFSSLSSAAVDSVLSDAVTWASRGMLKSFPELSMSATPIELRRISEAVTTAILSFGNGYSLESPLVRHSLSPCRVSLVVPPAPIDTITITISHWKSDGSAESVTLSITPTNSEHGVPGYQSARRFHYTAKADGDDRLGTKHPTVKPVDLMQWLTRLITPPGGLVLDAFAGTGTTGEAAFREGFRCILVEREAEYQADIRKRMEMALRGSTARKRAHKQAKAKPQPLGGMFEE